MTEIDTKDLRIHIKSRPCQFPGLRDQVINITHIPTGEHVEYAYGLGAKSYATDVIKTNRDNAIKLLKEKIGQPR